MPFCPLFPNEYVESVFDIDYTRLYSLGYRALIFDIDNTLVPHGTDCTPQVADLFADLHKAGFKTILLSNNSRVRIQRFVDGLGCDVPFIEDADKPKPHSFIEAARRLGVDPAAAIMIGDTTFTDIAGANKAGMASILVKYIGYYKKEKKGIRRRLEKLVLLTYNLFKHKYRLG